MDQEEFDRSADPDSSEPATTNFQPPLPPAAPPTVPGTLYCTDKPLSKWPMVIGVILIVWGGFALASTAFGLVMMRFTKEMMANMPQGSPNPYDLMPGWMMVLTWLWIPLSALQLAGGIGLVKRRAWSISAIWLWGLATIVVSIISSLGTFQMQSQMMGAGTMPQTMRAFQIGGALFGLALSVGWPAFVLIWISRLRIKNEIATWKVA